MKPQSLTGSFRGGQLPENRSAAAATTGISAATAAVVATATIVAIVTAAAQEKDKNDDPGTIAVTEVTHVRFLLSSYTTYYGVREKCVTQFFKSLCNTENGKH